MPSALVSSAEMRSLNEASRFITSARQAFSRGDRAQAMADLESVRALLAEPTVEPTRRMRLEAELGLAQMRLADGNILEARARADEYERRANDWFPDDQTCKERAAAVQRALDERDPYD